MDDAMIFSQQRKIRDLTRERDEAQHEAEEWRQRAEAIFGQYMELRDQLMRGDFVRAKRGRLVE